MSANTQQ